jgi:hypothetical protein
MNYSAYPGCQNAFVRECVLDADQISVGRKAEIRRAKLLSGLERRGGKRLRS